MKKSSWFRVKSKIHQFFSEAVSGINHFPHTWNKRLTSFSVRQVALVWTKEITHLLMQETHLSRKNFLEARKEKEKESHTSYLCTGAIKCIPAATVAIWWQAVGGLEDESCQWRPLKRTTHSPVTGEAWWMIISRCDRCCSGGGAQAIPPFLPPPPPPSSLSFSAYLGQCFNTPLTWLYWHTPDSVWWLMSVWVPLSLPLLLSPSLFLSPAAPHLPVILFSLSEQYSLAYLTHKAIRAQLLTNTLDTKAHIYTNV